MLRRAWWGISKRLNQSFILSFILITIGTLVIASLSIQAAAKQAELDARKALGSKVVLKPYDKTGGTMFKNIPISLADNLSKNKYVEDYVYVNDWYFVPDNFKAIPGEFDGKVEITVTGNAPDNFRYPELNVSAITDTTKLHEFKNGVYTLEDGHHITALSKSHPIVLIEKRLAIENDLQIGNMITMSKVNGYQMKAEITGIYRTNKTPDDVRIEMNRPFVLAADMPYNKMFMPFQALPVKNEATGETEIFEAIYYIDDPLHVPHFIDQEKANPLFDQESFSFNSNQERLKKMTLLINQVASFSSMMLWLVILCSAIVLSLLFIYFVKGRIREMGVLLSLGESRFNLITQLVVEAMILVIIAFSISVFSGNFVAKQASSVLLEQRQAALEEERQVQLQGADLVMMHDEEQVSYISTLEIKLSHDIWLRLVYVTGFILLISIAIPTSIILRLKPRTILTLQE